MYCSVGGSLERGERWGTAFKASCLQSSYSVLTLQANVVVSTVFLTQDMNVLISEVLPMKPTYNSKKLRMMTLCSAINYNLLSLPCIGLIGIHVPFLYFSQKVNMHCIVC